jgi:hypothetical protein
MAAATVYIYSKCILSTRQIDLPWGNGYFYNLNSNII